MGVMGDYGGLVILVIECIRRVYICFIKISLFLEMFDWVIVYLWFRFFFGLLSGDWLMNNLLLVREMCIEKGSVR